MACNRRFLWGAATSAYQCEGGYNGDGQPHNNWAEGEASGRFAATETTVDLWNRFEEDVARCKQLGLSALRTGIEWARVQPSFGIGKGEPPPIDAVALDAYADRLAVCFRAGIEPIVTLHHFTHPAWLGLDAWLEAETVCHFERFVKVAVCTVNRRLVEVHRVPPVPIYLTVNEPNMLVQNTYVLPQFPGRKRGLRSAMLATCHLLVAHVRAYQAIHALYQEEGWSRPQVGLNTWCSDVYWSDQVIFDLLSLCEFGWDQGDWVARLKGRARALDRAIAQSGISFQTNLWVWIGRALHRVVNLVVPRLLSRKMFEPLVEALRQCAGGKAFDFVGMDYYDPFVGHLFRPPTFHDLETRTRSINAWLMDAITSKWWDWKVLPEGLRFFCNRYAQEFEKPILIAENGMAVRRRMDNKVYAPRGDQRVRSDFLRMMLPEVKRLCQEGCPLMGYIHWSLTDNYEWGSFTPRFGLFSVDYLDGARREIEDPFGDRPSETYAELIRGEGRFMREI